MPIKNDSKSPVKYIIEITFGLDIQEGGASALSIWLQGLFFMQFISQEIKRVDDLGMRGDCL